MLILALILASRVTLDTLLTFPLIITVIVRMKYDKGCSKDAGPLPFLRWKEDGKKWSWVDTSMGDTRTPGETKAKLGCRLEDLQGSHLQDCPGWT